MSAALSSDQFASLMARLGPFESRPRLAIALSGGADSMALALLAHDWAKARGGSVTALTVDHGLRPESGEEAARVAAWMAALGIPHHILPWEGAKPAAGLQARAREARHGLLGAWCRAQGVLHLLLAHHREDQAETVLLRLGRGSGLDGLAAMAAIQPTPWGRLLRPLLDQPKATLRATLVERGQDWVEDPSNGNAAFARIRLRKLQRDLAAEGLTPERLAATARRLGRAREALERAVAEAACRWTRPHEGGFVVCAPQAFAEPAEEVALRLLSRLILAVGGAAHSPRLERLERLWEELRAGLTGARTLGGCRVVPWQGEIVVCREPAKAAPPVALIPGQVAEWDGRFQAEVRADAPLGLFLGALARRFGPASGIPACARATLPVLLCEDGVFAAPCLGYNQDAARSALARLEPIPALGLTASGRRLV